jgi:hypothetical protein
MVKVYNVSVVNGAESDSAIHHVLLNPFKHKYLLSQFLYICSYIFAPIYSAFGKLFTIQVGLSICFIHE